MLRLVLKPQAEDDLSNIFQYTAKKWSMLQAEKYQDELFEAMTLLTTNAMMGKEYTHSTLLYRRLHTNRHLIFYRLTTTQCIVVRILHETMEVDKHLGL